jgi:hypothetical protein
MVADTPVATIIVISDGLSDPAPVDLKTAPAAEVTTAVATGGASPGLCPGHTVRWYWPPA